MIINITVPATTANLGSGFDCIGAALSLYNHFTFSTETTEKLKIIAEGTEAHLLHTTENNLLYQAVCKLYQYIDKNPPNLQVNITLNVPLARGLGSSATAIVGGLVGANIMAGSPLNQTEIIKLAIEMEGHPDNVVPAFLGGCFLAATKLENTSDWVFCNIPIHNDIIPIVAIPDFELSTKSAREVLPNSYSRSDAIFNTAHLGLLIRALETGNSEWLKAALQDKIHQPYRKYLIPGYDAIHQVVLDNGGYGMVISGAGSTLLALTNMANSQKIKEAIATVWKTYQINPIVEILNIDDQGVSVN